MAQTITGTRNAPITMFRDEYIAGFERGGSPLRKFVTTEYVKQGSSVVFLVADSGNATAVTRGSDGLYPARSNNNNQITLTMRPYTDLPRMNNFDIFSSQGPQREIMFKTSQAVIGREVDNQIITALDTGTLGTSTAGRSEAFGLFMHAYAALNNANAGQMMPGELAAIVTPAFLVNMMKVKEFANSQYVDVKTLPNGMPPPDGTVQFMGVNIFPHSGLPGLGTTQEKCFMFHRNAVGHAIDNDTFNPLFGYNEEQDYSWVRCSVNMAAARLQNTGIVQMTHDGTSYNLTTV